MTSTLHLSSLENSILTPASSITPSPPPRRYPTPTTPTSAATTTDFDHEIYLDLSLLILNKNSENLFKIQCKINQNILNLQIIKNFIINLLSKVPILIQNNQLTSEVVDGKYETYIFHENHILLSSSLEENQHKYENNENKIIFTVFSEFGFDSFLKNYENLNNFIFAIGSDANALYLYDNWFLSDTTSIVEAIRVIENRTAEYYSSNERSESSLKFMRNDQSYQDEEFIDDGKTPSPIPIKFKRDELKGICESISFVVAPRASLPSLLLRITVQTFRSSDSPSGKTYTIDKVFVRVDDHEWMLQYRYSDFARLHDELTNQPESHPGYLPRQSLPHLPSKKLLSTRSSTSLYIDRRRVKLGKYMNALISLPGALNNEIIRNFLELHRITKSPNLTPSSLQRHTRNTMHVSKLNTEARWGDIILFKCNSEVPSHLNNCNPNWEWDHIGLVVLSQSEFSRDQPDEIIDDSIVSLDILEFTSEGVTMYPLPGRIRAYNYNNYVRYMSIRKLRGYPRTMEMAQKLNEFITSSMGKSHQASPMKLLGKSFKVMASSSPKPFSMFPSSFSDDNELEMSMHENRSPTSPPHLESTLAPNAELIASALRMLGIIPKHYNPVYFWPGAFAQNDEIDYITSEQIFNYGEELILDCTVMEVNRAVERYSLRKTFDTLQQQQDTTTTAIVGVGSSDDLPVSQPFLSHLNSSQVPNLALLQDDGFMPPPPDTLPMLEHYSSYGIPNDALQYQQISHVPDVTMTALVEGSSEDDDDAAEDQDEARKAAVREMLKSQSMNDLRFNSKHTVSQGLVNDNTGVVDTIIQEKASELLMNEPDDD